MRLAEFDELFATVLYAQRRLSGTRLRWDLDPRAEAGARDLTERETGCCSFFVFTYQPGDGVLWLDVEVPAAYVGVLDALASRAAEGMCS